MVLVFHEQIGLDEWQISPFSWRARMAGVHDRLGDRFGQCPVERTGTDGRATELETT